MQKFDIWIEGYRAQGNAADASKVTGEPIEAETFNDAVAMHVATLPKDRARYWYQHEDGHWSDWACRAYPDEASARSYFG